VFEHPEELYPCDEGFCLERQDVLLASCSQQRSVQMTCRLSTIEWCLTAPRQLILGYWYRKRDIAGISFVPRITTV